MNVLFDLDGTLTDPFEGITRCIEHALAVLDRPSPPRESLGWCIGPPLRASFGTLLATADPEMAERAVRIYRDRFATTGLFENEVYAGIPEALDAIGQAGHVVILATSKPTAYAEQILDHFGLRRHFSAVYGSELDGARSDKSVLLAHILWNERLRAAESIMVGDRSHDMLGAAANAIRGIGVLWGYGTREELDDSGATACVAHPGELVSAVDTAGREQPRGVRQDHCPPSASS